ncbi:hypothetical protein HUT15_36865 (plasmid) [Streptomyces sp. NA03103]|uniref:hypothetical protein n=1 Tax=Streptomyces sp. NA03103 TaxID=2742134 RepID=UPI001591DEC1|nr:hypothetical protein [Streptomyces sp. NA03103]QKW66096.1 hypothetical protein HUT15_36865 [Streptomyces sp. NA03103]
MDSDKRYAFPDPLVAADAIVDEIVRRHLNAQEACRRAQELDRHCPRLLEPRHGSLPEAVANMEQDVFLTALHHVLGGAAVPERYVEESIRRRYFRTRAACTIAPLDESAASTSADQEGT